MGISFEVKLNFSKGLKKLNKNNLYDGFAFTSVQKSYVIWNRTLLITTANDNLVITPYLNKNNPNTKKSTIIKKSDIKSFSPGKIMKSFEINLISGGTIKYRTTAVEHKSIVDRFNQWLTEQ